MTTISYKPAEAARLTMLAEKDAINARYSTFAAGRDYNVTDAEISANDAACQQEIDATEDRYVAALAAMDAADRILRTLAVA